MKTVFFAVLCFALAILFTAAARVGSKRGRLHDKFGHVIKKEDSVLIFQFCISLYYFVGVVLFCFALLFSLELFDAARSQWLFKKFFFL